MIKKSTYSFNQDTFKGPKFMGAFVLGAMGVAVITNSLVLGVLLIGAAAVILSYTFGIEIDLETKTFRYYRQIFLWKTGSWSAFGEYNVILILKKTGTKSAVSPSLAQKINVKGTRSDVYISEKNHRKRLFVCSRMDYNEARYFAEKLSKELDFPIEKYNPQVSRATAMRRSRRR